MPLYRLSVSQYHAMIEHGILTADDRVFELPGGFSERLHARIDLELKSPS